VSLVGVSVIYRYSYFYLAKYIRRIMEDSNPQAYQYRARVLASEEFNERLVEAVDLEAGPEYFYVVWFSKTLQNWKALVSTDLISGQYWEITHNGNKKETYVDAYVKLNNNAVPDASLS
jgi:hypothetical protein